MKKIFVPLILGLFAITLCAPLFVQTTSAASLRSQITANLDAGTNKSGLGKADPRLAVAGIITIMLSTIGIIFTSLMVFSGYNILTAGGDESKVEKARKTIQACVIGLAITLAAYSLTTYLTKSAQDVVNNTVEQANDPRWGKEETDDNIVQPAKNIWDYFFN